MQETRNTAPAGAGTSLDVRAQVAERPWLMFGAALAAGYMLGNLGESDTPSGRYSQTNRYSGTASQSWNDSQAAAQQWKASHPTSEQGNQHHPSSQPWNSSHASSQQSSSSQPASQPWRAGQPAAQSHSSAFSELYAPIRDEINNITGAAVALLKQQMREIAGEFMPADQRKADRGMPNPTAGTDYRKTYHPPDDQGGAP